MYGLLDVSASGMITQRTRLQIATSNLVNRSTLANSKGEYEPYRRLEPVIATGDPARGSKFGVHVHNIIKNTGELKYLHKPGHQFADKDGRVGYPDINPATEMTNALEASRAYQANVQAAEATKSLVSMALKIIA